MADQSDLERRIRRLEAAQEVQNLLGRYEYYHSAYRNDLIVPLFSTRPDTVIVMPFGLFRGEDAALRVFGGFLQKDRPPRDLTGEYVEHVLATPVVEVSADGERARGTWVSPGAEAHHVPWADGGVKAFWMWGRYEVEFIREDGVWKFLRFEFRTTFTADYDKSFADEMPPEPPAPSGPNAPDEPSPYKPYSETWHPKTFSLGPEPFTD